MWPHPRQHTQKETGCGIWYILFWSLVSHAFLRIFVRISIHWHRYDSEPYPDDESRASTFIDFPFPIISLSRAKGNNFDVHIHRNFAHTENPPVLPHTKNHFSNKNRIKQQLTFLAVSEIIVSEFKTILLAKMREKTHNKQPSRSNGGFFCCTLKLCVSALTPLRTLCKAKLCYAMRYRC